MFCLICRAFVVWKKRSAGTPRTAGGRQKREQSNCCDWCREAGKCERSKESGKKSVPQKKTTVGKEKKPSIHEQLEINKKIIQEKQGKDKPEKGVDLGVRTV